MLRSVEGGVAAGPAATVGEAVPSAASAGRARRWQGLSKRDIDARLRRWKRGFWLVALFSVVINLLMLTVPIYLMQLSDRVLTSFSYDTLYMLTIIAVGALMALSIFDAVRRYILTRIGMRMEAELGGALLVAGISGATRQNLPDVQSLRDLTSVRSFLSGPVVPQLFDLPTIPLYLGVVFLIHPHLGFILVFGGVLLFLFALANQQVTKDPLALGYAYSTSALKQAEAHVRNSDTVRAMGMYEECLGGWGEATRHSMAAMQAAADRGTLITTTSKFVRFMLQIAILGWGAYLSLRGDLTAGMAIAASIIGSRAMAPIEGTIEGWRSFVGARSAYSRIKEALARVADFGERTLLPAPKGSVSVENLVYAAEGTSDIIIKGVTFDIPQGASVAVIGATGAGKSTLARLIAGAILPSRGSVKLDGADLRSWDPLQLGEHVGFLPQSVELFPGTVAENIARMRRDASSEQIVAAAAFAGAHDLVLGFKDSYETKIHINGAPLSGGQRQRVGLARAFYGKPRLVVLDEPDANLDSVGERALLEAIMRAKGEGITLVMVTQRPVMLRYVDRILAIKDGEIETYCPRDALLNKINTAAERTAPSSISQGHRPEKTPLSDG